MDHARYTIKFEQTYLSFYGVLLEAACYEDSDRKAQFTPRGFYEKDGTWYDIEVIDVQPSPDDENVGRVYAYIEINNGIEKMLEVYEGPNGRIYHELGQ